MAKRRRQSLARRFSFQRESNSRLFRRLFTLCSICLQWRWPGRGFAKAWAGVQVCSSADKRAGYWSVAGGKAWEFERGAQFHLEMRKKVNESYKREASSKELNSSKIYSIISKFKIQLRVETMKAEYIPFQFRAIIWD
jgi:hypothetical protein